MHEDERTEAACRARSGAVQSARLRPVAPLGLHRLAEHAVCRPEVFRHPCLQCLHSDTTLHRGATSLAEQHSSCAGALCWRDATCRTDISCFQLLRQGQRQRQRLGRQVVQAGAPVLSCVSGTKLPRLRLDWRYATSAELASLSSGCRSRRRGRGRSAKATCPFACGAYRKRQHRPPTHAAGPTHTHTQQQQQQQQQHMWQERIQKPAAEQAADLCRLAGRC